MPEAVEFAPRRLRLPVHEEMERPRHGWTHGGDPPRQIEDDRSFPSHRYSIDKDKDQQHHHHNHQQRRHRQAHHHQSRELVHLPGASSLLTPISPRPPLPPPPPRAMPLSAVVTAQASASHTRRPSYHGDYATPSPVRQTRLQMLASSGDQHPMSGPMQQRRPADHGLSPTQSSISSSDRSDELELARYQTKGCSSTSSSSSPSSVAAVSVAAFGAPFSVNAISKHNVRTFDRAAMPNTNMANYEPLTYHQKPGSGSATAINTSNNSQLPVQPEQPAQSSPSLSIRSHASSPGEPNQMSITSLLSNHTDDAASAGPATDTAPSSSKAAAPPPFSALSPVAFSNYRLVVRQQPVAARSCGFGERDRRVVDPPPIVQLEIVDSNASREVIERRLENICAVVHCTIWSQTGDEDYSSMPEDFRQQRRLMGSLVGSPFVGFDEYGRKGCFFCFPDLSCRTAGVFRLKFSLVVINPILDRLPGARKPITATALSDTFTVYNAKDFPGMQASTALTRKLKEQGCLISIKKGNDRANTRSHQQDGSDMEEEDEYDEGGSEDRGKGKGRKKQKTRL